MKNWKWILTAAVCAVCAVALASCDDDDDGGAERVPDAVAAAFGSQYGSTTRVEWDTERGGYYVAEFLKDGREHEAWYTAAGQWAMTEVDYARNLQALPQAVQDGWAATAYARDGWTVDDIDEIQRPGYETVYVLDVEKYGQPDHDLYFDLGGTLYRDVQDGQQGGSHGGMVPGAVPEQIKAYVDSAFAGAAIVDFDREDGGRYEVDLRHGGRSVEVTFGADGRWLMTKTDLSRDVPDMVRNAVSALYPTARIDDCDLVETAAATFYAVETERPDLDLTVGTDGSVAPQHH